MAASEPNPSKKPRRRVLKRLAWISLGVLGLLTLLVLLTPTLLSFGPGRSFLLSRINEALGATVTANSIGLSWSGRASIRGLEVRLPGDATSILKADLAAVETSLVGLFKRRFDIRLEVSQPEIHLVRGKDGRFNFERLLASPRGKDDEAERPKGGEDGKRPGPAEPMFLKIDVDVHAGVVTLEDEELDTSSKLTDMSFSARNDDWNRPIDCSMRFRLGHVKEEGSVEANGTVDALEGGAFEPARLRADVVLKLRDLDLKEFESLAGRFASLTGLRGSVAADLALKIAGTSRVDLKCSVQAHGLQLEGGPLGPGGIREDSASLDADGMLDFGAEEVDIRELALVTTPASIHAKGTVHRFRSRPGGDFHADADVDLERLVSAAPGAFPNGLKAKGAVKAMADVADDPSGRPLVRLFATVTALDLRGGALTRPIIEDRVTSEIQARVAAESQAIDIETARLATSFATVEAKGTLEGAAPARRLNLSTVIRASLDRLTEHVGGTLPEGLTARGSIDSKLAITEDGKSLSLAGTTRVTGLRLQGGPLESPVTTNEISLDIDAVVSRESGALSAVTIRTLDVVSDVATVSAKGEVLGLPSAPRARIDATITGDLGRARSEFSGFFPNELDLRGTLRAGLTAKDEGQGTAFRLHGSVADLFARPAVDAPVIEEQEITWDARARTDRARDRLEVGPASLECSFGRLTATGAVDRLSQSRDLSADLAVRADLASAAMRLAGFLPKGLSMTGTLEGTGTLRGSLARGAPIARALEGRMDLRGGELAFGSAGGIQVSKGHAVAELGNGILSLADATATVNGGSVTAKGTLDLSATGPASAAPAGALPSRPFRVTTVANDVSLSGDVRSGLQYAIPLFARAPEALTEASGVLSWDLALSGDLARPKESLAGDGTIRIAHGSIAGSPTVGELLKELGGAAALQFDSATAEFRIENQRVFGKRARVDGRDLLVGLEGSVGFDQTLDYRVDAKLTSSFLSKADRSRLGPVLDLLSGDDGLPLPITLSGTLTRPRVKLETDRLLKDPSALGKRAIEIAGGRRAPEAAPGGEKAAARPEDLIEKGLEGLLGGKRNRDEERSAKAVTPLHALWKRLVDEEDRRVDYGTLAADEAARRLLADTVAAPDAPSASKHERLAAALNRYDLAVVLGVVENLDAARRSPRGVRDVPGFFDRTTRRIAGEDLTLDQYEARIRALGEPLHPFGLSRASLSGPQMPSQPFGAGDVMERLEKLARRTLESTSEVSGKSLRVSEILFDRGEALVGASPDTDAKAWRRGVAEMLARFLPKKNPAVKAAADEDVSIVPRGDWDWRLNSK